MPNINLCSRWCRLQLRGRPPPDHAPWFYWGYAHSLSAASEVELMFGIHPVQAHFIVDEMLMNGCIVETNKQNILAPVQLLEKAT